MLLALGLGACAHRTHPVETWQRGQQDEALAAQQEQVMNPSRELALENLRLASMALAKGDQDLAERAMRAAVVPMTTFQAKGEFVALVGAERSKEWKGEPYEKMAAFLTLGVLLHAEGDRGNAMAMYKSAVLADTGTFAQRFRSDFVPGWALQALALQAEGERDNAEQVMTRAVDAWWSRRTIDTLSGSLTQARPPSNLSTREADLAKLVLSESLAAGVTAEPRDPRAAARATLSVATDLLRVQEDMKKKERLGGFQELRGDDWEDAARALPAMAEAWVAQVESLPPDVTREGRAFDEAMMGLLREQPNVILVVERGDGPGKTRLGRYGELLSIQRGRGGLEAPKVTVDDVPVRPIFLDDLTYQATTRGGRRVDAFLKGKAVYKDTSVITGYVLLRAAEVAAWSDDDELALVLAIVGGALYISGALTNPAADVRQWELLPNAWWLVAGTWEPGEHSLVIAGHRYTLVVPSRGQVVGLVPAEAPYGSDTIKPRGD